MSAPTYDLGKLHGGLRLPANKKMATGNGIIDIPIPSQLVIPIQQHAGEAAQPLVSAGDYVQCGQTIAEPLSSLCAPVHASSSGTVVAIEAWPVTRRYGDTAPCIVIETDGKDTPIEPTNTLTDYLAARPEDILQKILEGGIVGLGGAVFPTAQKLMQARPLLPDRLILNGVECEPYISCDDLLMREHALEILSGAQILMHALRIPTCDIAIESDKPEALAAMSDALGAINDERFRLKQVPTIYPSGGEDQLIQLLTHREVPTRGLPSDVGCLVQNVGTSAAIHDWIIDQRPLISRVSTITGNGIHSPCNVRARIGTTVADAIAHVGGYTDQAELLIIGGPMTGKSISTDRVPIVKATNCVLCLAEEPATHDEMPCIRCGECAEVCPVQLMPQQLYWYACADNEDKLREFGLTDCIECGCCDLVCPSHIPLTYDFRMAKARIREQADEKARAERARRRFEARENRLEREELDRQQELEQQRLTAKTRGRDAIAEILARKKGKR